MKSKAREFPQIGKGTLDIPWTPRRPALKRKRTSPFWTFKVGESRSYKCPDSNLMLSRTGYIARTNGWKFRVHLEAPGVVRVWRVK